MKVLMPFLCVALMSISAMAQSPEKVIARVYYMMQHKRDTLKRDSVYKENMILLVGKNVSLFSSFDKIVQSKKIEKQTEEQTKSWTGDGLPVYKHKGLRKVYTDEIYHYTNERKRIVKEFLVRNYLYEQPLENVKWNLTEETKIFGKINAQKATAVFKGRNWEVWFAVELPFETGPWKLHGLPGLILEAYDITGEIAFLFNGFEAAERDSSNATSGNKGLDKPALIELPKKMTKINEAELLKLRSNMYRDPKGFRMAQLMATGGLPDNADDMLGFSYIKINNPIEKPDKN